MERTEEHGVILLREILASDLFSYLKDKRSVKDRWVLFQKRYKARLHQEETAIGISVDDMSE